MKKLAGLDDGTPPRKDTSEEEAPEVIPPGQSLADALAGRVGTQSSGGRYKYSAKDSGKAFTEMMVEKRKQGRL